MDVLDQNPGLRTFEGADRTEASTILVTVKRAFSESMGLDALADVGLPSRIGGS